MVGTVAIEEIKLGHSPRRQKNSAAKVSSDHMTLQDIFANPHNYQFSDLLSVTKVLEENGKKGVTIPLNNQESHKQLFQLLTSLINQNPEQASDILFRLLVRDVNFAFARFVLDKNPSFLRQISQERLVDLALSDLSSAHTLIERSLIESATDRLRIYRAHPGILLFADSVFSLDDLALRKRCAEVESTTFRDAIKVFEEKEQKLKIYLQQRSRAEQLEELRKDNQSEVDPEIERQLSGLYQYFGQEHTKFELNVEAGQFYVGPDQIERALQNNRMVLITAVQTEIIRLRQQFEAESHEETKLLILYAINRNYEMQRAFLQQDPKKNRKQLRDLRKAQDRLLIDIRELCEKTKIGSQAIDVFFEESNSSRLANLMYLFKIEPKYLSLIQSNHIALMFAAIKDLAQEGDMAFLRSYLIRYLCADNSSRAALIQFVSADASNTNRQLVQYAVNLWDLAQYPDLSACLFGNDSQAFAERVKPAVQHKKLLMPLFENNRDWMIGEHVVRVAPLLFASGSGWSDKDLKRFLRGKKDKGGDTLLRKLQRQVDLCIDAADQTANQALLLGVLSNRLLRGQVDLTRARSLPSGTPDPENYVLTLLQKTKFCSEFADIVIADPHLLSSLKLADCTVEQNPKLFAALEVRDLTATQNRWFANGRRDDFLRRFAAHFLDQQQDEMFSGLNAEQQDAVRLYVANDPKLFARLRELYIPKSGWIFAADAAAVKAAEVKLNSLGQQAVPPPVASDDEGSELYPPLHDAPSPPLAAEKTILEITSKEELEFACKSIQIKGEKLSVEQLVHVLEVLGSTQRIAVTDQQKIDETLLAIAPSALEILQRESCTPAFISANAGLFKKLFSSKQEFAQFAHGQRDTAGINFWRNYPVVLSVFGASGRPQPVVSSGGGVLGEITSLGGLDGLKARKASVKPASSLNPASATVVPEDASVFARENLVYVRNLVKDSNYLNANTVVALIAMNDAQLTADVLGKVGANQDLLFAALTVAAQQKNRTVFNKLNQLVVDNADLYQAMAEYLAKNPAITLFVLSSDKANAFRQLLDSLVKLNPVVISACLVEPYISQLAAKPNGKDAKSLLDDNSSFFVGWLNEFALPADLSGDILIVLARNQVLASAIVGKPEFLGILLANQKALSVLRLHKGILVAGRFVAPAIAASAEASPESGNQVRQPGKLQRGMGSIADAIAARGVRGGEDDVASSSTSGDQISDAYVAALSPAALLLLAECSELGSIVVDNPTALTKVVMAGVNDPKFVNDNVSKISALFKDTGFVAEVSVEVLVNLLGSNNSTIKNVVFSKPSLVQRLFAAANSAHPELLEKYHAEFARGLKEEAFYDLLDQPTFNRWLAAFGDEELPAEFANVHKYRPMLINIPFGERNHNQHWALYEPVYRDSNTKLSVSDYEALLNCPKASVFLAEKMKDDQALSNLVVKLFNGWERDEVVAQEALVAAWLDRSGVVGALTPEQTAKCLGSDILLEKVAGRFTTDAPFALAVLRLLQVSWTDVEKHPSLFIGLLVGDNVQQLGVEDVKKLYLPQNEEMSKLICRNSALFKLVVEAFGGRERFSVEPIRAKWILEILSNVKEEDVGHLRDQGMPVYMNYIKSNVWSLLGEFTENKEIIFGLLVRWGVAPLFTEISYLEIANILSQGDEAVVGKLVAHVAAEPDKQNNLVKQFDRALSDKEGDKVFSNPAFVKVALSDAYRAKIFSEKHPAAAARLVSLYSIGDGCFAAKLFELRAESAFSLNLLSAAQLQEIYASNSVFRDLAREAIFLDGALYSKFVATGGSGIASEINDQKKEVSFVREVLSSMSDSNKAAIVEKIKAMPSAVLAQCRAEILLNSDLRNWFLSQTHDPDGEGLFNLEPDQLAVCRGLSGNPVNFSRPNSTGSSVRTFEKVVGPLLKKASLKPADFTDSAISKMKREVLLTSAKTLLKQASVPGQDSKMCYETAYKCLAAAGKLSELEGDDLYLYLHLANKFQQFGAGFDQAASSFVVTQSQNMDAETRLILLSRASDSVLALLINRNLLTPAELVEAVRRSVLISFANNRPDFAYYVLRSSEIVKTLDQEGIVRMAKTCFGLEDGSSLSAIRELLTKIGATAAAEKIPVPAVNVSSSGAVPTPPPGIGFAPPPPPGAAPPAPPPPPRK